MLHSAIEKAYLVLEKGVGIDRETALELINLEHEHILDLVSLANKVSRKFSTNLHACSIINAKSGVCRENCRFCAQSAHHSTNVDVYDLLDSEKILEQAHKAYASGVSHYGIVTSGTGFKHTDKDFQEILKTIDLLYRELPTMKFCTSLGLLDEQACYELAQHGVAHYNINLQVTPERFKDLISTTHEIDEKIKTIKYLQKYGIQICCGGIIGVGEDRKDRVALAFALKELEVDVIPLNVLVPIAGTPLENQEIISAAEAAKAFAVTRLVNPKKIIKFAAGRETVMKDFMGLLMLSGANGLLTGGYLTTRGRDVATDSNFIQQLEAF